MAVYVGLSLRQATKHATREETLHQGVGRALCSSAIPVEVQYEPKANGFGDATRPQVATTESVTCLTCLRLMAYHGLVGA